MRRGLSSIGPFPQWSRYQQIGVSSMYRLLTNILRHKPTTDTTVEVLWKCIGIRKMVQDGWKFLPCAHASLGPGRAFVFQKISVFSSKIRRSKYRVKTNCGLSGFRRRSRRLLRSVRHARAPAFVVWKLVFAGQMWFFSRPPPPSADRNH